MYIYIYVDIIYIYDLYIYINYLIIYIYIFEQWLQDIPVDDALGILLVNIFQWISGILVERWTPKLHQRDEHHEIWKLPFPNYR